MLLLLLLFLWCCVVGCANFTITHIDYNNKITRISKLNSLLFFSFLSLHRILHYIFLPCYFWFNSLSLSHFYIRQIVKTYKNFVFFYQHLSIFNCCLTFFFLFLSSISHKILLKNIHLVRFLNQLFPFDVINVEYIYLCCIFWLKVSIWECIYLKFGTAVAACIGGGTVYGKGNFAATAGFSNNIFITTLKNLRFVSLILIFFFLNTTD